MDETESFEFPRMTRSKEFAGRHLDAKATSEIVVEAGIYRVTHE